MTRHLPFLRNAVLAVVCVLGLYWGVQDYFAKKRLDAWLQRHTDVRYMLLRDDVARLKSFSTEHDFEAKADDYLAAVQKTWQLQSEREYKEKDRLMKEAARKSVELSERANPPAQQKQPTDFAELVR